MRTNNEIQQGEKSRAASLKIQGHTEKAYFKSWKLEKASVEKLKIVFI